MKRNKLFTLVLAGLLSLSLASCGSDNSSNGGGGGTVTSTTPSTSTPTGAVAESVIKANEGKQREATNVGDFRELVRTGHFKKASSDYNCFGTMQSVVSYAFTNFECSIVSKTHDFLIWDDVFNSSSLDCDDSGNIDVKEYYNSGSISGHPYGNSKQAILNKLLELIDSGEKKDFAKPNGHYVDKTMLVVVKSNKAHYIDLKMPIAANPVLVQENVSNTEWNGMQVYPYYNLGCSY